ERERPPDYGRGSECLECIVGETSKVPTDHNAQTLRHVELPQFEILAELSVGIDQSPLIYQVPKKLLNKKRVAFSVRVEQSHHLFGRFPSPKRPEHFADGLLREPGESDAFQEVAANQFVEGSIECAGGIELEVAKGADDQDRHC